MNRKIFNKNESVSYQGDSLKLVKSKWFKKKYGGKINLIFTSPPFNLILKKSVLEIANILKNEIKKT